MEKESGFRERFERQVTALIKAKRNIIGIEMSLSAYRELSVMDTAMLGVKVEIKRHWISKKIIVTFRDPQSGTDDSRLIV